MRLPWHLLLNAVDLTLCLVQRVLAFFQGECNIFLLNEYLIKLMTLSQGKEEQFGSQIL